MATDALGLGMALAAIVAGRFRDNAQRTFGLYRLEILAALANAVLLFVVAGYVLHEAVQPFEQSPEVLSGPMLVVAVLAGGELVGWHMLKNGASESINVEGAYLEVIADLIGSVGRSPQLSSSGSRAGPTQTPLWCSDGYIHPPPSLASGRPREPHPGRSCSRASGLG